MGKACPGLTCFTSRDIWIFPPPTARNICVTKPIGISILDWEVPRFWMRNKEDRSNSWNQEVLHKQMTYPKQVD